MLVLESKSCSWCFRDHILSHRPMQDVRVQSVGQEDPLKKEMQPTQVLPEKYHGQRSLADYSPWGCTRVGYYLQQQVLF